MPRNMRSTMILLSRFRLPVQRGCHFFSVWAPGSVCHKARHTFRCTSRTYTVQTQLIRDMSYSTIERGQANTLEYRMYIRGPNGVVSPFHDIPLYADEQKQVFNMVVEVPRWTNAKMEISTSEKMNPIRQDVKKGMLRFVHNCFPHHGYIWNYGALPQTWEDPEHTDVHTEQKGDNDPIDVCEIGYRVHKRGAVVQVKVLGVMALIDEGETDWKILAIDVTDPIANKLEDIGDIEEHMPGFLQATNEWFRIYKIPSGKPVNQFAFEGKAKDKEFALGIIEQTHNQWRQLVLSAENHHALACTNVSVADSAQTVSQEDADFIVNKSAPFSDATSTIDANVDMWHYPKL